MPPLASARPASDPSGAMTAVELRASLSLACIFALRMLGLFLVLPVFALEARQYPGGDDVSLVGLAMGLYGLTQAVLQIPFGMASDRFGRKPVILVGLLLFAVGSLMAALAPSLAWLAAGRALQGCGAISAAVTALLADQTRDLVRTKAMALIGASIGLMFAISLVIAPSLASALGLAGLFALTAVLALAGMAVVLWWVPPEPARHATLEHASVSGVLSNPELMRCNLGVLILHMVQLAMWMAVPAMLEQAGLPKAQHWWVYLPAVLGSFFVMAGTLFPLERRGYLRAVFLVAIACITLVQIALWTLTQTNPSVVLLTLVLFVFFWGFNVLEASQPSFVSRLAPAQVRGTAMGVYNTLQSLGLFAGGAAGGWLVKNFGPSGLFITGFSAMLLWLLVAWPMRIPATTAAVAVKAG